MAATESETRARQIDAQLARAGWTVGNRTLIEEFLRPLAISQNRLGKDLEVSPRRINEIIHGKRAITADTALRLSRYFGTTDRFWLNLQTRFDLETEKVHLGPALEQIQPLRSP